MAAPTSLRLPRYLTASPASNHPVAPCQGIEDTPRAKISEVSERYCGLILPSVVVPFTSPMKRAETYGRMGRLPSLSSVLTCPYPKASFQRLEKNGKIHMVVLNRS